MTRGILATRFVFEHGRRILPVSFASYSLENYCI